MRGALAGACGVSGRTPPGSRWWCAGAGAGGAQPSGRRHREHGSCASDELPVVVVGEIDGAASRLSTGRSRSSTERTALVGDL